MPTWLVNLAAAAATATAAAATAAAAVAIAGGAAAAHAAGPAVSDLDVIRGTAADAGFARVTPPVRLEFPRDQGPHAQFRHEWWYLTGNLDSAAGQRFGFELTFFRLALAPPAADAARTGSSAWRTRQIYAAHFAVTDVAARQFSFSERRARDALGLAGAESDPFRVWVEDWMLGSQAPAAAAAGAPADAPAGKAHPWRLHCRGQDYELDLQAQPLGPPVPNGEGGLSRKSSEPGAASVYYSIPRVAVHGTVTHQAKSFPVTGMAWLDREWGSGSLGSAQQGWDWFALQFRDGSSLMFYALRNRDGSRDSHSAGTWVDPGGKVTPLGTDQVAIDVANHWISPRGGRYPSRWRLRVASVGLDVEIRPVLADQELVTHPRYWEGAVDVEGARDGRSAGGRGYVELVGYGE